MQIDLDYPINPFPRYGYGKPPHPRLYEIIKRNRKVYEEYLHLFLNYKNNFRTISHSENKNQFAEPYWENGWFFGLDSVALYSLLCLHHPQKYYEIGSGNSTKFARKAINDYNLSTKIVSFDPQPRSEINDLCDAIFRQPVEEVDLKIFDDLESGDILFVDNSHRIFTNSDVTVFFLDILPRLKPGVLVHIHDIFLPFDYPPFWQDRYYSEQYILAAYLLAESSKLEIILPNAFIYYCDPELNQIMYPLWTDLQVSEEKISGISVREGSSFWIKITSSATHS
ncbi:MAG: class I SAM-dependent methyltransferase [Planktothrix sp.]|uniref:class I SAM-dependent methyltransferase n=1 Tax=Planktothrix sp. TaxID=3088171 RepID=UPI0038D397A1